MTFLLSKGSDILVLENDLVHLRKWRFHDFLAADFSFRSWLIIGTSFTHCLLSPQLVNLTNHMGNSVIDGHMQSVNLYNIRKLT